MLRQGLEPLINMSFERLEDIITQLAEEHNGGWIPCSERLPESGVHVLCYGKNSLGSFKYEVSVYAEEIECWMCSKIADVIAWQPLPSKYAGGGKNE